MANLTLRQIKGSPLTITEMDGNFEYFTGSYTNTGTITAQGFSGSFTGSLQGTAQTASYVFIAGAGSQYVLADGNLTSGTGGSPFPFTGFAQLTGSLIVTAGITGSLQGTAQTASYVQTAQTASFVQTAQTSSYVQTAQTASFVTNLNQNVIISGSLTVSGSIIPAEVNGTLGTAAKPWKELFIDGATIVFISGSSSGSINFTSGSGFNFTGGGLTISGSPVITSNSTGSNATTGSNSFTGNQTISGSLTTTGSVNITGSININGSTVITSNQTGSFALTGSTPTTGSNTFNGSQTISGSLLISGSIIPNVGSGSTTSSFSLGSPTNAWKDIYVSNGTINFLDGTGNVQGTIGTGTNATVITGSLKVVPINPLTSYTPSNGTLLHKSYTTFDCAFTLYDSTLSNTNQGIYWRTILNSGKSLVLPWDTKIAAYSLVNDISVNDSTTSTIVSLPPIMNAGYSTGDQITVYNLGKTSPAKKSSGSIFIVSDTMGVTNVDSSTKQITGTHNESFILSGSWGNYTQININYPATTSSIQINPGQKATFEIVYWGTIYATPSSSIPGFSENGYATNSSNNNPSNTFTRYLFKGIENL